MSDELCVNPETLREAAQRLTSLAGFLTSALSRNASALRPLPAGIDEVSAAAARWSSSAAGRIAQRTEAAATEMRATADALTRIAAAYAEEDHGFSSALNAHS